MALFRNAVGPEKDSQLYVWSQVQGASSKRIAVISAHGGRAMINGMAQAPDCALVFYSPHGQPVNDPSLEAVLAQTVIANETVRSRRSQDYALGKYTNTGDKPKHNTVGENYAKVGGMDTRFATASQNAQNLMATLASMDELTPLQEVQLREQTTLARLYATLNMDIITIRNRAWHLSPRLSWVLTELWAKGYDYDTIHCSFCRGGGAEYAPPMVDLAV